MYKKYFILLFILVNVLFSNLNADESLKQASSVQWLESKEYDLLCYQIYQSAQKNLIALHSDKNFSSMLEQGSVSELKSAIVVDIDETILLNLAMRKELLEEKKDFTLQIWKKHIELKSAVPINGSLEYLLFASKYNIKVIYISNRYKDSEDKTFILLQELGYPISSKDDILLQDEREDWSRNKSSRRKFIANRYRVIQMFGDNLRDFTETNEQAIKNKNKFGHSWFLLPNPIYGNWLNNK